MSFEKKWTGLRAEHIAEDSKNGYNLSHTFSMIYYTEKGPKDEQEKQQELVKIVEELRLVYNDCKEQLNQIIRKDLEVLLDNAKNGINNGRYWDAIMDVHTVEQSYLQEYLPKNPLSNKDIDSEACVVLIKKIVEGAEARQ